MRGFDLEIVLTNFFHSFDNSRRNLSGPLEIIRERGSPQRRNLRKCLPRIPSLIPFHEKDESLHHFLKRRWFLFFLDGLLSNNFLCCRFNSLLSISIFFGMSAHSF